MYVPTYIESGTPKDWTNGTGVFPSGGSITIPPNAGREWFRVQNRDLGTVTVSYTASNPSAPQGTFVTAQYSLGPAPASGGQGGSDEMSAANYIPTGGIVVTGIAGQKVTILEG